MKGQNHKRFSLFGSLSADGPMFDLGRGVLEDSRSQVAEKSEFFPFILPTNARFLMFQVDSFYGEGGGLHFFAENERRLLTLAQNLSKFSLFEINLDLQTLTQKISVTHYF